MQEKKHLAIEFSGVGEKIVGSGRIDLMIPADATYHDALEQLAEKYPKMVDVLIDDTKRSFVSSTMFILNDEMRTPIHDLSEQPEDGTCVVLLSTTKAG